MAALAGYSTFGLWLLKIQLLPLLKGTEKLSTETKERIDKLGTETKEEMKELRLETKQSFVNLEMQMKESHNTTNSRVDSVLLRSLDLQRVPKPAGGDKVNVGIGSA